MGRRLRGLTGLQVIGLVAWLALAVAIIVPEWGVFFPDVKPEIYLAPARSVTNWASSWQADPQLGVPSFNVGLAPVGVVTWVLDLFMSPWLSARVLRLLLYTLAAFGAAVLARRTVSGRPGVGLAAAVAYLANPYAVVAGATLPVLWPYALLPWLAWALFRAVQEGAGWRWPARAALIAAAMTGMNAGAVPVLQSVVLVAVVVLGVIVSRTRWRDALVAVARFAGMALALSLYWLVPALLAVGAGENVIANSETTVGISQVSGWGEVLRGLGLWPMYGGDALGPWVPEQAIYLSTWWGVLASFAWTVGVFLCLAVARGRVRLLMGAALVASAAIMAGSYPPQDPSPLGRALDWAFSTIPGLAVLRTTNKAGASMILAAALLIALVVAMVRGSRSRTARLGAGFALAACIVAILPGLFGAMRISPMPVPGYWTDAAAALDTRNGTSRIWMLPGQSLSHYTWSRGRPDDLGNSLFSRPTLQRFIIPTTSAGAANLLGGVDQRMQDGTLAGEQVSRIARRLGVSDLLVRNDIEWNTYRGIDPARVADQLATDNGLRALGGFGPAVGGQKNTLRHFEVNKPAPQIETLSADGRWTYIVGDGEGLLDAVATGLLADGQTSLTSAVGDIPAEIGAPQRIVVTDSNRRRVLSTDRLQGAAGPLLHRDDPVGRTLVLGDTETQTTVTDEGGVRVDSPGADKDPGERDQELPANALDGNSETAWTFGGFDTAVGRSLRIESANPMDLRQVRVKVATPPGKVITGLELSAGGQSTTAAVSPAGVATLSLPITNASSATLTVTETAGEGFNAVKLYEVEIPGAKTIRVANLPKVTAVYPEVSPMTPIDYVFWRAQQGGATPADDEEQELYRNFVLPNATEFTSYGWARLDPYLPDAAADRLSGFGNTTRVAGTSRYRNLTEFRGSLAADGDATTAWVPDSAEVGQAVTIDGPPRAIEQIVFDQPRAGESVSFVTKIDVLVDGRRVASPTVVAGKNLIRVQGGIGSQVVIRVAGRTGDVPSAVIEARDAGTRLVARPGDAQGCVSVSTVSGWPLLVKPSGNLASGRYFIFGQCPATPNTILLAGAQQLRPSPGFQVKTLTLKDIRDPATRDQPPIYPAVSGSPTDSVWSLPSRSTVSFANTGRAFDPRWRATLDGEDLGAPLKLDGWSAGWVVPSGAAGRLQVTYGPEAWAGAGLVASSIGLVTVLALSNTGLATPSSFRRRRPRRAGATLSTRGRVWVSVGFVLTAGLVGGVTGIAAGLVAAAALFLGVRSKVVMACGLVGIASLPIVFFVGNGDRWGEVSPELVVGNPWTSLVALTSTTLIAAAVLAQEGLLAMRSRRPGGGDDD